MQEVVIAVGFLFMATLIGLFLKPNADQLRPLTPETSTTAQGGDDHHHVDHHH